MLPKTAMGILVNDTPDGVTQCVEGIDLGMVAETIRRACIDQVLSSATFARADQLRRLLAWLGERSLRPDSVVPTEKEIGKVVLLRKDFDPQTDSLVRKEM